MASKSKGPGSAKRSVQPQISFEEEADCSLNVMQPGGNQAAIEQMRSQQGCGAAIPLVAGNPLNPLIEKAYGIVSGAFAGMVPPSVMERISSKTGKTADTNEGSVPFVRYQDGIDDKRGANLEPTIENGEYQTTSVVIDEREDGSGENLYDLIHEFVHVASSGAWLEFLTKATENDPTLQRAGVGKSGFREINEDMTDWLTEYACKIAGIRAVATSYNKAPIELMARDIGPMAIARLHFLNDRSGFPAGDGLLAALKTWFGRDVANEARAGMSQQSIDARYAAQAGSFTVGRKGAKVVRAGDFVPTGETFPGGTRVTVTMLSPDNRYGMAERPDAPAAWVDMRSLARE